MAPRVMTVSGPIPPERIGFTLPHEHTGIYLWHIQDRWDYWELTPDEDLIADELRDYRRRGGSTLVDLTLPGVGRDPERLRRLASRTGVQVVMGCGWYREAYYPPEALIDRRSVDDLADELIGELRDGVAARACGRGSSARSGPTSRGSAPRRSGCIGPPRAPHARPAWRSPRTACDRRWRWRSCASSRRRAWIRRGSSSGMPIRTRCSTIPGHPGAWRQPAVRLPRPSVPDRGGGGAAAGGAHRRAAGARLGRPAAAQPGRVPQQPAQGEGRLRLHLPAAALPADPAHRGGRGGEIQQITVDNPRRILTIRVMERGGWIARTDHWAADARPDH